MRGLLGQRGFLAHGEQDRLAVPQDDPDRNDGEDRDPQALPDGPPDVAHRVTVAAELGRHHRRGGVGQAEPEDQRREIEVGAERAGGKRVGAQPPDDHHIGRRHRRLREIGEDHRPGELQHRANLVAPRRFRGSRRGFDRRHVSNFQKAARPGSNRNAACIAQETLRVACPTRLFVQSADKGKGRGPPKG